MKNLKRMDNKLFSQQESVDYLISEYEQCFQQMRHYDTTQNTLLTFALTGYIAIFAAVYTLYQYSTNNPIKYTFLTMIFILSTIAGIIVLMTLARNRVYYTAVAKQVNRIRNYFLSNSELDFIRYNNCYVSYDKPKNFYWLSTYAMYIVVISLFNASLIGSGVVMFNRFIVNKDFNISLAFGIITGLIMMVLELIYVVKYFHRNDSKNADDAVWDSSSKVSKKNNVNRKTTSNL